MNNIDREKFAKVVEAVRDFHTHSMKPDPALAALREVVGPCGFDSEVIQDAVDALRFVRSLPKLSIECECIVDDLDRNCQYGDRTAPTDWVNVQVGGGMRNADAVALVSILRQTWNRRGTI